MLIYLDANIVQYCADYGDLIFSGEVQTGISSVKLEAELRALGQVIHLALRTEEQDLDHRWDVAAPKHLLDELFRGKPTPEQRDTYELLREAWCDLGVDSYSPPDIEAVIAADMRLRSLELCDEPDRRHLAEAIAMGATWFLTLDNDVLYKTRDRDKPSGPGRIEGVIVARPSELRARMTFDPVFGLRVAEPSVPDLSRIGIITA